MIIENGKTLKYQRTLHAPVAAVWSAWTDPQNLRSWWKDLTVAELDVREGGKFRLLWKNSNPGDSVFGMFRQIVKNQKLVFSWNGTGSFLEKDTLVSLSFEELGPDQTRLTLLHEFLGSEKLIDDHEWGWAHALIELEAEFNSIRRKGLVSPVLEIRRTVPFAPSRVFQAWSDPKMMNQWFNRKGHTLGKAVTTLQPNGYFRMDYQMEDGTVLPHWGRYQEIEKGRKLVFTWMSDHCQHESKVTLLLIPAGDGTEMVLRHENLVNETERKMHQAGWEDCLQSVEEELPLFSN